MRTRREAIENLEYLISGECCDSHMDYVDEIQMAITDMKICEANNVGWISVKDRLPERSGYYLCYKPNAAVDGLKIDVHRFRSIDGDWGGSEVGSRIIGITHWIPLPEPPKEET